MKSSLILCLIVASVYAAARGTRISHPQPKRNPMVLIGSCVAQTNASDCGEFMFNEDSIRATGLSRKDYEVIARESCIGKTFRPLERCSRERTVGHCDLKQEVLDTVAFLSQNYSYAEAGASQSDVERIRSEKQTSCNAERTWNSL